MDPLPINSVVFWLDRSIVERGIVTGVAIHQGETTGYFVTNEKVNMVLVPVHRIACTASDVISREIMFLEATIKHMHEMINLYNLYMMRLP